MLIAYGVVLWNIESTKKKTAIVVRPKKGSAIIVYTKLNTSLVRLFHSSCYRKVDEYRWSCPNIKGNYLSHEGDLNEEAKKQNSFNNCMARTRYTNY